MDQPVKLEVHRAAIGQLLDAMHDRAQRSLAGERVGDAPRRLPRPPHNAKLQQVK
jgi:hypothetical protein